MLNSCVSFLLKIVLILMRFRHSYMCCHCATNSWTCAHILLIYRAPTSGSTRVSPMATLTLTEEEATMEAQPYLVVVRSQDPGGTTISLSLSPPLPPSGRVRSSCWTSFARARRSSQRMLTSPLPFMWPLYAKVSDCDCDSSDSDSDSVVVRETFILT